MNVQPYLYFEGRAGEAIEFYKQAIGAEVGMLMKFSEAPSEMQSQIQPGMADKVMHACINIGDSPVFISDGQCGGGPATFSGITLTLNAKDDAEAKKLYAALSKGGKEQMPLTETFFATSFGMVADKFGVSWMVLVPKKPN
ncbi:MAG: VOC family protein [Proteobacteria bacterium]|nr:VOC family protein [Pseudomonadota bacterium]